MARILIPVTDEGKQIAQTSQNYVEMHQYLEGLEDENFVNAEISLAIHSILPSLEQKLQQQIRVENAMSAAGIKLTEIFNKGSLGAEAFYDAEMRDRINLEELQNGLNRIKSKTESNQNNLYQKQKKVYETLESYYQEISSLIQHINVEENPKKNQKALQQAIEKVDKTYAEIIKTDKEVASLIEKAKKNIQDNILNDSFVKVLQNIQKLNIKTPNLSFQRNGTSLKVKSDNDIPITKESVKIINEAFAKILKTAQGIVDTEGKSLEKIISGIKYTSKTNAEKHLSDNSYMKNQLLVIKEQLLAYLQEINKDVKEESERKNDILDKIATKQAYQLLNNIVIKNGKISLPKFTIKERHELYTSNTAAALGTTIEKTFAGKPQDLNLEKFLQGKENVLFAGGTILARTQFTLNENISKTLDGKIQFDTSNFSAFDALESQKNQLYKTKSGAAGKIDNIEKVMGKVNGKDKGFIIAYSDKFVSGFGMTGVSLIKDNSNLISSLDLFVNSPNSAIMNKLYQTAISLSSASVDSSESKQKEYQKIASKILSGFFMEMAFDSANFESQIQSAIDSSGLTQTYGTNDNVLYVMRVTNTYHPASHILTSIITCLKAMADDIEKSGKISNIVKASIQYDQSSSGMEKGSLWDQARHAIPSNKNRDARWSYVAAQAAKNTHISASVNIAVLNRFMNIQF